MHNVIFTSVFSLFRRTSPDVWYDVLRAKILRNGWENAIRECFRTCRCGRAPSGRDCGSSSGLTSLTLASVKALRPRASDFLKHGMSSTQDTKAGEEDVEGVPYEEPE
eukprot:1384444-Amorphochlora_amoeboformis.AAC.1